MGEECYGAVGTHETLTLHLIYAKEIPKEYTKGRLNSRLPSFQLTIAPYVMRANHEHNASLA